ncbi:MULTISPECIES: acyl-CoA dehydrogenase family protein [unclassified Frankia]|uniref:acyl-CoA dehydrogenase family protein n=1 Tax=unclassified Frankia TaxID=2632575 RepID=UPI002AD251C3|nr:MULTISPECIES: acyl-CoA dehydrogenase family protein [unclassified Frankia]
MEFGYPSVAEEFRVRVRAFLAANLPDGWTGIGSLGSDEAEVFTRDWRDRLFRAGLLGVSWPAEYGGGGLTKIEQVVLMEELAQAGAPWGIRNDTFSIKMVGNTLLRAGTEEQKHRFLPKILSGEEKWCQGYSEPGAGSDLASLRTRAVLDGDEWVIDGQKIWTSMAHEADWIFVLARTDPDARPHRGISFLLVPLRQPGIEVRPIPAMNGDSEFNEVFFVDARTAADNVVGTVNGGWQVAMTLLGYERGEEAATNPVLFRNELDRLRDLVRERGLGADPIVRQRLADCYARVEVMRFLGYRVLTGYLLGGPPGPESSISKLYWSEYHKLVTDLSLDVLGAAGMVMQGRRPPRAYRTDDPGSPNSTASWIGTLYNSVAGTIYAGSSQVQRNILGETVLGLPKEPAVASGRAGRSAATGALPGS